MGKSGKTRPFLDRCLWHELAHHRFQRGRAQQHGFLPPARVQKTIGEDMTPLPICTDLRLVQCHESVPAAIARHRLDRAQKVAGARRLDPLLPGNQRAGILALDPAHLVVHLARQQTQRKTDGAGGMTAHSLDRKMGLAGVRRP